MGNKLEIDLIVYDFDGVMTDNKVYIDSSGSEIVQVNRSDGLAVSKIKELKIKQLILSTEKNEVVKRRSEKLGIDCIYNCSDKKNSLEEYCKKENISLSKVGFIGNDINDLEVMESVNFTFCPSDAHALIKELSRFKLSTKGGDGVIREFYEFLVKDSS
tara:strand:+ start:12033 stop:12509 length:477 start_codon:yes stop_codon:yes gene_type:complete